MGSANRIFQKAWLMKNDGFVFPFFLLVYHLCFAIVAWQYYLSHPGDAYGYWHLTLDFKSYFKLGTDVVRLFSYPFAKIFHLPLWSGFLLYSLIGYLAIYELYKFSLKYIKPGSKWIKYLLLFIFLLPNLHFWTSIIGKEPIIFLSITWIFINQIKTRYFNFQYILGWILLILIRPHVAMFLLLAISFMQILKDKSFSSKKISFFIFTIVISLGLYLMTMHLLNRNPYDISYILERNDASLIAFKRADSYVPMIDYNWAERFFALNFRPLFADSESLYSFVLSVENFFILILLFSSLIIYILRFKTIKIDLFAKIAFSFLVICSLFFIQRYSCLGIFVRTKIMYLPFLLVALVKIMSSKTSFNKSNLLTDKVKKQ